MTAIHIIALLVTGSVAGFASSLLGIGGGIIMTPIQFMIFTDLGVPESTAIKLAFGTNLLVILPTAISGVWRHQRKKAVFWRAALIMGSVSFLASFGGSFITAFLPGRPLKIGFGFLILASALRMLMVKSPRITDEPRDNPWLLMAWALPIGLATGLVGIGGGIVGVPIMTLALRFKIHNAVATSLGMMILGSVGGIIGYIINGRNVSGLPSYSLGYVNLQSAFLLAVTSVAMAQLGAITAHRLPAKQLGYVFVVLLLYMGLKMLGVFTWLGWPI